MKRSNLRMEGEPPYSPAVPDDISEQQPSPLIISSPAPLSSPEAELSEARCLPAAEEVDIPAQIELRDRLAAEAPRPFSGFVAGAFTAFMGAVVFGAIAGFGGCSCKAVVVGAGFAVTAAVRRFGQGSSPLFSVIGAVWALIACATACVFATYCELARRAAIPANDPGVLNWGTVLQRAFGPAELLWCTAVVVAAWVWSRKPAVGAGPDIDVERARSPFAVGAELR